MAKLVISDLGSTIAVGPNQDEHVIPALGNNALIPGDACYRDPATGRVVGSDIGGAEFFEGIMKESQTLGPDAAPGTDVKCSLIVPQSGHRYRVNILDPAGNKETGSSVIISGTAGKFAATANIVDGVATLSLPYVDNDLVAEVSWK